ncbi:NAD(P)H-binding protein [Aeromicrobium sp. CF3.5]|uniref:NAD(P)H-binding protein n=1 Tax=Aeromicrobium sp. CF3.5 TaxID=3373078 RepID=UPI003EE43F95
MRPSDSLLIGCGRLGSAVGLRLAELGHDVAAIRRSADQVPAPLTPVAADLTAESPALPPLDLGFLVVALTARPRTEESYRATYVDGMLRALDAVEAAGQRPTRAVLVSSTGVFGDLPTDPVADEDTRPGPVDGPGQVLGEAERAFIDRLPHGTVLRMSGLYDGTGTRLLDQVRTGQVSDPHRWTNRIHRHDAAAAVVHLLTMADTPASLYLGTDDEPIQLGEVLTALAAAHGLPVPPAADPTRGTGKRLSNARLRATGWTPTYPTFREGFVL